MDRVFEAAVHRRDELQQELKKLDDFIGTYRQLAIELHIEAKNEEGTLSPPTEILLAGSEKEKRDAETAEAVPPKRARVRDNPKPADVAAAAVEVIRSTGRPMTRREIHTALKERGMEVRGADPIKALGTMLWRSGRDQLVQIEGRGYWPKADIYEPAEYYGDL